MPRFHKVSTGWLLPVMSLTVMMGIGGCGQLNHIREHPEPWQVIEPGKPMDKPPRVEIVKSGEGSIVEAGDVIQVHVRDWSPTDHEWRDMNDWWLWIGFSPSEQTAFYGHSREIASALVGRSQGTSLRFLEGVEEQKIVGGKVIAERTGRLKLQPNPLGDPDYYSWRKYVQSFMTLSVPSKSGYYSLLEIKRVCKGKAQYRTVRLFDDSPVERCTWAPLQCSMTSEPREGWVDEAKIEAVCQDGRTAIFQFGPLASRNGKEWTGPINPYNYFTEWEKAAWKKLPTGVQVTGNRAPEIDRFYELSTVASKPLAIPLLAKLKDPDGDQVYVKVLRKPTHGTLVEQPLGVWTYTPVPNWLGEDEFRFKASDGILESGEARVAITVTKAVGN